MGRKNHRMLPVQKTTRISAALNATASHHTPSRGRTFSASFTASYPAIRTVPAQGRARVGRMLRSAVFPAPLDPKNPGNSPA